MVESYDDCCRNCCGSHAFFRAGLAKLLVDLEEAFTKAGKEVLWDGLFEKWKTDAYDKSSAAELVKKGMEEIVPFPREDFVKIQKAILDVWLEECRKLSPEAVAYYKKITSMITIPK